MSKPTPEEVAKERKMKNKCFEDYLAKQYTGTDDLMPDDWGEWVAELDVDQIIKFADAWMKEEIRTARQEGFNGGVERTRSVAKENIFCCPECTDSKCDKFYYFDEAIRKLKKEG